MRVVSKDKQDISLNVSQIGKNWSLNYLRISFFFDRTFFGSKGKRARTIHLYEIIEIFATDLIRRLQSYSLDRDTSLSNFHGMYLEE